MSNSSIQSVLQQLQTVASQASGEAAKGRHLATSVGKGGFADELHSSIQRINQAQQHARAQVVAFESGASDVSLNDVMVDMQKASLGFEMGVQVRNRLVSAYRDIMNMQV